MTKEMKNIYKYLLNNNINTSIGHPDNTYKVNDEVSRTENIDARKSIPSKKRY